MKIKKKIKKKSGSKTEILRNTEAQPKQLVSYKKKECITIGAFYTHFLSENLNILIHTDTLETIKCLEIMLRFSAYLLTEC